MSYYVEFKPRATDGLAHLDALAAQRVMNRIEWLSENLDVTNPKALTGQLKGLFRLRAGDYRILYSVSREQRLIAIHFVSHRKDIYKSK